MAKKTNGEEDDSLFYEDLDEDDEPEEKEPKRKGKKKPQGNNTALYIIVGLIIVIGVVLLVLFWDKLGAPKEQIAATVNGKAIPLSAVEEQYATVPEAYRATYPKERVLQDLIQRELLLQEAANKGVTVADTDVEALITSMKSQFGTEKEFTDLLAQQNITLDQLRKELREQLIITRLVNETVFSNISVSEEEIQQYYDENAQGQNLTLVDVHDDITQILVYQKQKTAFESYLNDLTGKATIVNFLNTTQTVATATCAQGLGLEPTTVTYYTSSADWCSYCKQADAAVQKLQGEGTAFHIADINLKAGLDVVQKCFPNIRQGVPQFICPATGEVLEGALTEQELRDFVKSCKG